MEVQAHQNTTNQTTHLEYLDEIAQAKENFQVSALAETFNHYMDVRHSKFVTLTNPKEKKVCSYRSSHNSRYTPQGRQKINTKISKRLRHYPAMGGVLVTATIADPPAKQPHYQGEPRQDAWKHINKHFREFWDKTNKYRKRRGLPKVRAFAKVLENQSDRNYPHLHSFCPGLRWLGNVEDLQKMWPYGNLDITYIDSTSPARYLTKYISKTDRDDFMNVMLFSYNLRLYSTSRGLPYAHETKTDNAWYFSSCGTRRHMEEEVAIYQKYGYSLVGQQLQEPRGP